MSKRITIEELQSYLWNSAVLLRTNIDAGAYKQYIFPLLFFKRICDVYDEETALAIEEYGEDAAEFDADEIHTFVVPEGYHWNDVRAVSENVGVAIVEAFRKVENANVDKLQGIFGDGAWTNKNRLPDRLLKDLLEHFSTKTLSIANCPEDELGQGYEYLIKKFADDSGHTAQEFYTNRTVVHLMTEMLKPESGESIYDPTCGSAGMLISAIAYLKAQNKEWRNVSVYGQEINALTSAIGKMNLFLHGVKDFNIVNGDTLKAPAFVENGKLQQFDLCLANPPYSISQWDRAAFESDKYGRNFLGVPPQGRARHSDGCCGCGGRCGGCISWQLEEYAHPRISYVLSAMDLSVLTGYEHEAWALGDIVTVDDKDLNLSVKTRVVRRQYNLQEPWNTVLELSTTLRELGDSSAQWDKAADVLASTDVIDRQEVKDLVPFNHLRNSRGDSGLSYWVNSGFEVDATNGVSGTASFKAEGEAGMTKSMMQTVYPANRSSYTFSAQIASENLEKGAAGQVGIEVVFEYEDGTTETRFIDLF